jgi:hypothetical protein
MRLAAERAVGLTISVALALEVGLGLAVGILVAW